MFSICSEREPSAPASATVYSSKHVLEAVGAAVERGFETVGLAADCRFELRQVGPSTFDDLRQLELLAAELFDELRNFGTELHERLAEAVAGVQQGMALAREFVDQAANLALVFLVRLLEGADLVVDQHLKFASPPERARDGVVHERHLAPDGLAERRDRLLGHAIRLGEAHRDFRHCRRAQVQLFRAPHQVGQEPEQHDRADEAGERPRGRRDERARSRRCRSDSEMSLAMMAPANPTANAAHKPGSGRSGIGKRLV